MEETWARERGGLHAFLHHVWLVELWHVHRVALATQNSTGSQPLKTVGSLLGCRIMNAPAAWWFSRQWLYSTDTCIRQRVAAVPAQHGSVRHAAACTAASAMCSCILRFEHSTRCCLWCCNVAGDTRAHLVAPFHMLTSLRLPCLICIALLLYT